jgi:hypothetical protein
MAVNFSVCWLWTGVAPLMSAPMLIGPASRSQGSHDTGKALTGDRDFQAAMRS